MRIIGLFTIYLWIAACTTTPLFPPEIMKDITNDTFAFKAWREQAVYPSAHLISQTVELEGQLLKAIPNREGVVLLVDGRPVTQSPLYGSKSGTAEDFFRFAILFNGKVDPSMLQTGNRLVVVGATGNPSPEAIGWMPTVLPHLLAHCLHIWKIDESELNRFPFGELARYPQGERTFCREESTGRSLSPGNQGDGEKGSAGS
ncbi:MAG: Slp family lipoprotein [Nitrospira sp.]